MDKHFDIDRENGVRELMENDTAKVRGGIGGVDNDFAYRQQPSPDIS